MSLSSRILLPMLFVLAFNSARAEGRGGRPTIEAVTSFERSIDDFYNAIAVGRRGVEVSWSVESDKIPREGEFALVLVVRNAANPKELQAPDLAAMTEFKSQFIFSSPAPDIQVHDAEVRIVYRVKIRQIDAAGVDVSLLRYAFYRWDFPEGKRFQTAYALPLHLLVVDPPVPYAKTPLTGPEEFFVLPARRSRPPNGLEYAWMVPPVATPAFVIVLVRFWRRRNPDAARLARLLGNRAARTALERLKKARSSVDSAGVSAAILCDYVAARYGVPRSARTPREVSMELLSRNFPIPKALEAEAFLKECDSARFASEHVSSNNFAERAENLILAWEGVRQ